MKTLVVTRKLALLLWCKVNVVFRQFMRRIVDGAVDSIVGCDSQPLERLLRFS